MFGNQQALNITLAILELAVIKAVAKANKLETFLLCLET
jgi:hypothetical protein